MKIITVFFKSLSLFTLAWTVCYGASTSSQLQDTLAKLEEQKKLIVVYLELNDLGEIVFVPIAGVAQPAFVPVKKFHLEDGIKLANLLGESSLEDADRKFPDLLAYSNKMILRLEDKLIALETQISAIKHQLDKGE